MGRNVAGADNAMLLINGLVTYTNKNINASIFYKLVKENVYIPEVFNNDIF